MKLLHSVAPNPRTVRMFLLEKGLEIPMQDVDLVGGENRRPPYTDANPAGQLPSLVLDDGSVIAETGAIMEYLEDLHPEPALIGSTPAEKAEARMWLRRVELQITEYLYNGFRFAEGLRLFEKRTRCIPEAAAGLKAKAADGLAWLDPQLAGREFIVGDRFTVADMALFCALEFGETVGQPLDPSLASVAAWKARVAGRPSAEKSLHPNAANVGFKG